MYHKKTSAAEVAGLEMRIGVTVGEVNQVAAALLELQEATALLVFCGVPSSGGGFGSTNQYRDGGKTKVAPMATSVISIALFSR